MMIQDRATHVRATDNSNTIWGKKEQRFLKQIFSAQD
jgi:hypothetical protein